MSENWKVTQRATDTPDAPGSELPAIIADEHGRAIARTSGKFGTAAAENEVAALMAAAPVLGAALYDLAILVGAIYADGTAAPLSGLRQGDEAGNARRALHAAGMLK